MLTECSQMLPCCVRSVCAETVPIRPFKHNEYERFIVQAYPYYASLISMMAGFLAVGGYFLYTK